MRFLRTNTAVRLTVGPFMDKTDGVTPETALTVTSCKLTLMVDDANVPTLVLDAAATASGGSNDMVHVTNDDAGFYDLELTAANLNYLGRAMLSITDAATHCPVFHEFMILPAMIYDSLVLGTDDLDTNTKKWNDLTTVALPLVPTTAGRTLDVSAGGEAGLDWANVGSPTTALALTGTTIATTQKVDVETIKTNPVVNGGTITFPTGATLASTTNITGGTITTVSGNVNGSVASVSGAVGSVTAGVTVTTNNDKTGYALSTAGVTAVRSLVSGTSDSGSTTTMVDAARTEADTDYWKGKWILFTSGTISGQVRLITGFTPASDTITFAPAVTQTVGTQTYEILAAARTDLHSIQGDAQSGTDLKDFADEGYDPATNKVQGVVLVDTTTTATTATNLTNLPAIPANWLTAAGTAADFTTEIQAGLATAAALTTVDTVVDAILALLDDARTEPGQGAPPVNPDLATKIDYLYKAWRNKKTQDSTTHSLFNDAGDTVDHKATVSDSAGTFTHGEIVTGP